MKGNPKTEKYISRQNLKRLLDALLSNCTLIAPAACYGDVIFKQVESAGDIVFDYTNALNSAKDYLLMNDEPLFRYNLNTPGSNACNLPKTVVSGGGGIVIFGSRPCDTKAVGLLDNFFSRNFDDPQYSKKRGNTIIITLACRSLGQECFCTSTESGPYLDGGYDVQLVDIGSGFFVEAGSSKGRDFVKRFSGLLDNADTDKKKKKQEAVRKAISSKNKDFDLGKVYNNLSGLKIPPQFWKDLGQRCQSCGGCLLICPACSCFYVVEKKTDDKTWQRVRSLDACYYEGFTRMAGGYNPVSSRTAMMERKFYHKMWQQPDEFKQAGCTGCGRCNQICPGNINWLEALKKIEKV